MIELSKSISSLSIWFNDNDIHTFKGLYMDKYDYMEYRKE